MTFVLQERTMFWLQSSVAEVQCCVRFGGDLALCILMTSILNKYKPCVIMQLKDPVFQVVVISFVARASQHACYMAELFK